MAPREGTKAPGISLCPFGSRRTDRRLERPLPVGTLALHPPAMLWAAHLNPPEMRVEGSCEVGGGVCGPKVDRPTWSARSEK
eukprot:2063270-Prymnesium_polylepis.1